MHRVAVGLAYTSDRAHHCHDRLSSEDAARDLTVMERIDRGDREAIYDAIVDACAALDELREKIGQALSDGDLDVLAKLRAARTTTCAATICSSRWYGKETAATDRSGKERRRKAASRGRPPASHG